MNALFKRLGLLQSFKKEYPIKKEDLIKNLKDNTDFSSLGISSEIRFNSDGCKVYGEVTESSFDLKSNLTSPISSYLNPRIKGAFYEKDNRVIIDTHVHFSYGTSLLLNMFFVISAVFFTFLWNFAEIGYTQRKYLFLSLTLVLLFVLQVFIPHFIARRNVSIIKTSFEEDLNYLSA